jgi:hypothetical protein
MSYYSSTSRKIAHQVLSALAHTAAMAASLPCPAISPCLASDESSWVTGADFAIDGGTTAW